MVEQDQLLRGFEQALVVVLPVDLDQPPGELGQELLRHRPLVDPGARLAVALDRAPEDQLALRGLAAPPFGEEVREVVRHPALERARRGSARHEEAAFDERAFGTRAHEAGLRALAEQELERPDQQALAGAGLAGDHVQARAERERLALEQHQVADGEFGKQQRPLEGPTVAPAGGKRYASA